MQLIFFLKYPWDTLYSSFPDCLANLVSFLHLQPAPSLDWPRFKGPADIYVVGHCRSRAAKMRKSLGSTQTAGREGGTSWGGARGGRDRGVYDTTPAPCNAHCELWLDRQAQRVSNSPNVAIYLVTRTQWKCEPFIKQKGNTSIIFPEAFFQALK